MQGTIWTRLVAAGALFVVIGCSDRPSAPTAPSRAASDRASADRASSATVALVRQLAAGRGVVPLPRAPRVRRSLVELGQALAFDKIISGNRDISCMTCHLPAFA